MGGIVPGCQWTCGSQTRKTRSFFLPALSSAPQEGHEGPQGEKEAGGRAGATPTPRGALRDDWGWVGTAWASGCGTKWQDARLNTNFR